MTAFYFIRHGQMDFSLENTKFFQGRGTHMIPLSELGRQQIKTAAQDERLRDAQLIISSPFGRTLHSAAILSKELGLDIRVEPDLHEWAPNTVDYAYLPQEEAGRRWHALHDNHGRHPAGEMPAWESAEQTKARVFAVLDKYRHCRCVIAVCHGTLMQYVLDIPHPSNGQIVRFDL